MSIHKAIVIPIIAFALAAVSPAAAMAGPHATHRPVVGVAWGVATVNVMTLELEANMSVRLSHFGRGLAHFEAQGVLTPDGTRATGPFEIVAVSGDRVTGTWSLAGPAPSPNAHTADIELRIAAGTGRFEGARGTLRTKQLLTPFELPSAESPLLRETAVGFVTGRISY